MGAPWRGRPAASTSPAGSDRIARSRVSLPATLRPFLTVTDGGLRVFTEVLPSPSHLTGTLWHFTCEHRQPLIDADGYLKPNPQPLLENEPLVWLAASPHGQPEWFGLTGLMLKCDRMAYRYTVDPVDAVPWYRIQHEFPTWRVRALHAAKGTRPELWWISRTPVRVISRTERITEKV